MKVRLAAAVLAAGASSRMGALGPKALLATELGDTFLERAVARCVHVGASPILVVAGAHPLVAPAPARVIRNDEWPRGQLSSLQAALAALPDGGCDGLLVTLVDHPLVAASTFARLADEFTATRAPLVRPVHAGRRGHPIVIRADLFAELTAAPTDRGARPVFSRHAARAVDVVVDDPGIHADLDTPEDLARH